MTIPQGFERWVAAANEGLTSIVSSEIIGNEQAKAELSIYHPNDPKTEAYGLRHTALHDGEGYAFAASFSGNWHADMRRAYSLLRLRIRTDSDGTEILLDANIDPKMPVMEGWKITRWELIKEGRRPTLILKDRITWSKGKDKDAIGAVSVLGWRPYIGN